MIGIGEEVVEGADLNIRGPAIVVGQTSQTRRKPAAIPAAGEVSGIKRIAPIVDVGADVLGVPTCFVDFIHGQTRHPRLRPHGADKFLVFRCGIFEAVRARIFLVRRRAVIAFEIILHGEFPVRRYGIGRRVCDFELREAKRSRFRGEARKRAIDRGRIIRQANEYQPLKNQDVDRHEAVGVAIETIVHQPAGTQATFQIVSPSMVRTGENPGVASLLKTDPRPAMAADIEVTANFSLAAAHNNDGFRPELEKKEIPHVWDLAAVAGPQPVFAPKLLEIPLIDRL